MGEVDYLGKLADKHQKDEKHVSSDVQFLILLVQAAFSEMEDERKDAGKEHQNIDCLRKVKTRFDRPSVNVKVIRCENNQSNQLPNYRQQVVPLNSAFRALHWIFKRRDHVKQQAALQNSSSIEEKNKENQVRVCQCVHGS